MQPANAWVLAALVPLAAGCIAPIKENRLYGAPRPRFDGAPDVIGERKQGQATVDATVSGSTLKVSVIGTSECRDVDVTSRVRDVALRRSFADDAQEKNGALAMLLGAGAGALQLSADQINCPSGSACWSRTISAEYGLLALAAVPLGFVVYNALRVRDGRTTEPAPPEIREGAWRTCSTEPLPGEPVAISIGGIALERVTDRAGHVSLDLTAVLGQVGAAGPTRALIRHPGSPDLWVDLKM